MLTKKYIRLLPPSLPGTLCILPFLPPPLTTPVPLHRSPMKEIFRNDLLCIVLGRISNAQTRGSHKQEDKTIAFWEGYETSRIFSEIATLQLKWNPSSFTKETLTYLVSARNINAPKHGNEHNCYSAADDEVWKDQDIVLSTVRVNFRWNPEQRDRWQIWYEQGNGYWKMPHFAIRQEIFGGCFLFPSRSAAVPYSDQRRDQQHDGEHDVVDDAEFISSISSHVSVVWS